MRRYSWAGPNTSAGVAMSRSMAGTMATPTTVKAPHSTSTSTRLVWTAWPTFSSSWAP